MGIKDIKDTYHYNKLSNMLTSLDEANVPEIKELNEKWNILKKNISKDTDKIEKMEKKYRDNLHKNKYAKKEIKKIKKKMKSLRNIPLLSRAFLNISKLFGNENALKYASYKRRIKNWKDVIRTSKSERASISAYINKKVSEKEENKKALVSIEKTIENKYKKIQKNLDIIIFYENHKEELAQVSSENYMKSCQNIIECMKEGKELPNGIDKKSFKKMLKENIKNKDNEIDSVNNEQNQNSRTQQEQSFKDSVKDWPAIAFTKYQIDKNKLQIALKNYDINKSPEEYLCSLGKMCLPNDKRDSVNNKYLLIKGLQIVQNVCNGNSALNKEEKLAYKTAESLISSTFDLRMDSSIYDNNQGQNRDMGQIQDR